uniref:methylmalonate-semialdehyde dehydrogenase (CoA acylating) n=1 Tax=Kalanchoe fedtschenkoi TaxID=63787 RepID=A0A7N0UEN3_KALFE
MMDIMSHMESADMLMPQMLPPPPGSFADREELIQHAGDYAVSQGYIVTIKQSKKDKVVVLGCDRGGVYRDRRKPIDESSAEHTRKRKSGSRLTNCPFELVGKKDDDVWVLSVKNGMHNHEPIRDISEHPAARRFSEKEVMLIKEMTDAGLKPRQIIKRLKQSNPEILSTSKNVYNVKAKFRRGSLTVRNYKSLRLPKVDAVSSQASIIIEPSWKQRNPPRVPNLIGGSFVDSQSFVSIDVNNPATQHIVSQVPLTTGEELRAAVFAAKQAFPLWRDTPVSTRQHIMLKLLDLIRRDIDKIALSISTEHGKILKEAYGDVQRGIEAMEHICGLTTSQMGDFTSNVSSGVDTFSIRAPLGVCAGICSHHFPAMVPLWMFPISLICGNTFILKPSEKAPGASIVLAELAMEAGLTPGVLNVVHGNNDIINSMCDDDDIKAISYVGSKTDGMYIYARASARGKRVQTNVGAKNVAVVMPDARFDSTLHALVSAGFGAVGQKCTSLSAVIFVGCLEQWENILVERVQALKVKAGTEPDADLGPVISKQVKAQICNLIQISLDNGARLVLDGRHVVVSGYEHGNFLGPTILDITSNLACYKDEISGPVLLLMQAVCLEQAIHLINSDRSGSGASIFTTSGLVARKFQTEVEATQVGINVTLPSPLPNFSVTGARESFAGDQIFYGKAGLHFYTQVKTVTQQWRDAQAPQMDYLPPALETMAMTHN